MRTSGPQGDRSTNAEQGQTSRYARTDEAEGGEEGAPELSKLMPLLAYVFIIGGAGTATAALTTRGQSAGEIGLRLLVAVALLGGGVWLLMRFLPPKQA
jgi:hypothetical protein